ncbi:autophagy protein 16 [Delitschia confertaspora ATCC 74209]|uniref:Autophagy protein 16 n=1 Tax=Delitschia confertaspora ATCC 74209 TaxID=1513339 RepID=A0A9P4JVE9_9PLEO|nr:autophagy protein 16 [Delitschia confertaspora ATCC 74209]
MSSGLAEYLSALEARDHREQAHAAYINAYTKLADRTGSLSQVEAAPTTDTPSASAISPKSTRPGTSKGKDKQPTGTLGAASANDLAQLRADLASTQKARIALESKLAAQISDSQTLKAKHDILVKRCETLERAKAQLEQKLRDRAEELKVKDRLVENAHDEMVALNLQLNMAEENVERVKKDNDELTRRWMEKMEREAEEMNKRSKW